MELCANLDDFFWRFYRRVKGLECFTDMYSIIVAPMDETLSKYGDGVLCIYPDEISDKLFICVKYSAIKVNLEAEKTAELQTLQQHIEVMDECYGEARVELDFWKTKCRKFYAKNHSLGSDEKAPEFHDEHVRTNAISEAFIREFSEGLITMVPEK